MLRRRRRQDGARACLLDNALRPTPRGGEILLAASAAHGSVNVLVADTGRAIPSPQLALLFAPDAALREAKKAHGGGLELAIAGRILALHGSHLAAESTPGEGNR